MWALDIIKECGYKYSSSIYPIKHDLYGIPNAQRFNFMHEKIGLYEVPLSTVRIKNVNVPCSGGGFFRLYPYWFSKWAIKRINNSEGKIAVFYFHPWELDPEQPRIHGITLKSRFRHYLNLHHMESRLVNLCRDFLWTRIDKAYGF